MRIVNMGNKPRFQAARGKNRSSKQMTFYIPVILVIASLILGVFLIINSVANQKNNIDYAELNHVKYGLLSVDVWKKQIIVILAKELRKLNLSHTDERDLRIHIEALLNTLIDQVAQKIKEGNEGSAGGWIKQTLMNIFISLEDIKKGIPTYSDAIIHELTKSKTKREIRGVLNKQLKLYLGETYNTLDTSRMERILLRLDAKDIEDARDKLQKDISKQNFWIIFEAVILILLTVSLFSITGFSKQPLTQPRYTLLVLTLLILLIIGVTTPMINMEAKISQMSFMLLGYSIHFENQILYYQSKSILDVFWIMITHKDIPMKFVGILMIIFSIVFPLLKIASTLGYFCNFHNARKNKVIKFFVLKSGKWSMADVMVIAIFMAYIGFNGIINSLFGELSSVNQDLVIMTTNGTCLQPGYYIFLTYTLLALFLSEFLIRKHLAPTRRKLTP